MIIFVFFNFLAFWPFPWQRQPFWKTLKSTTCIVILRFFFTIIITSPRLQSGDHVLLFYVSFSLLLLRHPDSSQVIMYCYSTFLFHYYSSTQFCHEKLISIIIKLRKGYFPQGPKDRGKITLSRFNYYGY
jgi:hypothetical protein